MRKALTIGVTPAPLFFLVSLFFLVPLALPSSSLAVTPTTTEKQVLTLVNYERTRRGLAPVRFQSNLTVAARAHSSDMARRNVLTHYSAGTTVAQRLLKYGYKRTGYSSWSVGENVGCASTSIATARKIVSMWMNSTAHRAIILKRGFRDAGIGTAKSGAGLRFFTLDVGRRTR